MMNFIDLTTTGIISAVAKAVISGSKEVRKLSYFALVLIIISIILFGLVEAAFIAEIYRSVAVTIGAIAALAVMIIYGYQLSVEESVAKAEIKEVEARIIDKNSETTAAWELGRIKVESYLNRNLIQVRWIFIWTVLVMIVGFLIVGYGIFKLFLGDIQLNAAILAAISGLLIEFLGGSFLIIFKSSMQQAKDYVTVLERINAVGMSVQILDSIRPEEAQLQDQTKANIAIKLLELYGELNKSSK
ncbi:hypothetical protein DYBT9623_00004 [Dyadobacter sp. CECT 9623]|uniref:Cyanobacterial TRADD-N associated 2 transmembrane domain-containing protein n=2 Tax=Dyadobacter linearis TaxID=2823330 RepID=A0ABM8UIV4_9BACT|nr:hypothetical protein DYBT9623_00004 [Dyadobacter sp. CECT 9623]